MGHSALAGSTWPELRTISGVPNPSLTLGAALEELSAFHGHQLCMKHGIPQLCLSPRSFIQSFLELQSIQSKVSWSNLLWRDVNHTLPLSTDGILKAPSVNKPDGHSCPPRPIPWGRVQGCPGRSLLLQTWVGVGETMHHHSVSTITLPFLPWAGSCFFWKRCRQELSRGLCC